MVDFFRTLAECKQGTSGRPSLVLTCGINVRYRSCVTVTCGLMQNDYHVLLSETLLMRSHLLSVTLLWSDNCYLEKLYTCVYVCFKL